MTTMTLLFVGIVLVLAILVRFGLEGIGVPPLVGYFLLGIGVRVLDERGDLLGEFGLQTFEFLAALGVIALLFRIGLESRVDVLIDRLPEASLIWAGDVVINFLLGYGAARYLIGWDLIPSLFVAIALTATSVGVSATVWREAGLLDTPKGALMLDVAEMDDLSGVVLMALLFTVAPVLHAHPDAALGSVIAETLASFLATLLLFGVACVLFSRYVERHITAFFQRFHSGEGTMLVVVGIGVIVAALAELIGFSTAIGAFFAGLIFSRDPESVHVDASFQSIHDLFAPFFFVGIGLKVDPSLLTTALGPAVLLLGVALLGKLLGTGGPAWAKLGFGSGVVLGVTMWPRAEIALIVMERGLTLGDWAVPDAIFANMVVVSTVTVIATPLLLRGLLARWPQTDDVTSASESSARF